ncbi:MAG: hypothetical protein RLZZ196_839, partial [Bacteroidota bacterium]
LTTRFVNPPDSTQETEEQFRARYEALGRSQSEIDELVLQFLESGGQFYVVDLFKYDNKFTTVRNAALNITTLTEGIPYWRSNIEDFNNVNQPDPILPSNELYSDSFTISLMGADPLNLEAYGKLANTIYEFTPSSSIVDLTLHTNSTAFKFNSNSGGSVSTIALKLKASLFDPETLLLSNSGIINLKIYSSNADDTAPDELISTSENNYLFTDLENDVYKELYWDINANLLAGTFYWAVVELNSAPQGGDIQLATQTPYDLSSRYLSIQAFSFVNLSDTNIFSCAMPIKVVLSDPNATDIDGLTNTTGTLDIQIYSANDDGTIGSKLVFSSINNSINFTSIKNYDIIFNFDATINLEKNIKYWVLFIPSERQRGGTIQVNLDAVNLNSGLYSQNLTDNSTYSIWDNWDGVNYKAWLKVSEVIPEVYGYFNRDLDYLDAYLPSANTNRITNGLLSKEGSWAFTLKKFPEPSIVTIYPRFSPGFYVPFSRDIYVAIRLMVGGKPKDYYIHLDPTTSPVLPIDINDSLNLADSIAYMYVAKTLEELQNGYHGAPAGDRLVIRST